MGILSFFFFFVFQFLIASDRNRCKETVVGLKWVNYGTIQAESRCPQSENGESDKFNELERNQNCFCARCTQFTFDSFNFVSHSLMNINYVYTIH